MNEEKLQNDIEMCINLLLELKENHDKRVYYDWLYYNKSKVKRIRITINELLKKYEK